MLPELGGGCYRLHFSPAFMILFSVLIGSRRFLFVVIGEILRQSNERKLIENLHLPRNWSQDVPKKKTKWISTIVDTFIQRFLCIVVLNLRFIVRVSWEKIILHVVFSPAIQFITRKQYFSPTRFSDKEEKLAIVEVVWYSFSLGFSIAIKALLLLSFLSISFFIVKCLFHEVQKILNFAERSLKWLSLRLKPLFSELRYL